MLIIVKNNSKSSNIKKIPLLRHHIINSPFPAGLHTWNDTHLYAYLGVHGPIKDLSIADPDNWGRRFGIVSMAGQIEWVTGP